MKGFGRAGLSALATSTLVIAACAAGAGAANADANFSFTRVDGHSRYDVSASVANKFGTASHVILASGEDGKFGDALAANYLAGVLNAPVLLTQLNTTPDVIKAALAKTGAKDITVVGGPLSVSDAQVQSLESDGYTVNRVWGHTRYDTDAAIIKQGATTGDTAIIATGEKFPDALSAGPLAFAKKLPVGLVSLGSAPQAVIDALKAQGVTKAIVLGGDLSVSQETRQQLENNGIHIINELNGANRAAVATQVADLEIGTYGFKNDRVNVATGREFGTGADALSAGPLTGQQNRPLLITAGDPKVGTTQAIGQDLLNWLQVHAKTLTGSDNLLFGGTLSISDAEKTAMEKAAQTVTSNQTYNVTPGGAQTAAQGKNVQYSVSGLDNNTTYTVALFNCDNVTTGSNGQTSFVQTTAPSSTNNNTGSGVAAQGDTNSNTISVLNGGPVTPVSGNSNGTVVTTNPTTGTITFTVANGDTNGASPSCVIPVVFQDANQSGTLNTDKANGQPTETFGNGGSATFTSPAAQTGNYYNAQVLSVDKAAHTFTADTTANTAGGVATFNYAADTADTYYYVNGVQLSQAQFADYLSGTVAKGTFDGNAVTGDTLDVTYNANGPSYFSYNTDVPNAPTNTTATFQPAVTGSSSANNHVDRVDVKWTAPSNPDVTSYNVYRADVAKDGTVGSYTLLGNTAANGATIPTGNTATGTEYYDNTAAAGHTYSYEVSAVAGNGNGGEGPVSNAAKATNPAASVPGAVAGAPIISDAQSNDAGAGNQFVVGSGDTIQLDFNEPTTGGDQTGTALRISDGVNAGTVIVGTNATAAYLPAGTYTINGQSTTVRAGQVLELTLTGALANKSTAADVAYPATITQITNNVVDTDESLPVDLSKGDTSINRGASAASAPAAPAAPTLGTATTTTQPLSWTAPSNTGNLPITGYTVTVYPGSTATGTPVTTQNFSGSATSGTITGLTTGTTYTYVVQAANAAGTSPQSAPATGATA